MAPTCCSRPLHLLGTGCPSVTWAGEPQPPGEALSWPDSPWPRAGGSLRESKPFSCLANLMSPLISKHTHSHKLWPPQLSAPCGERFGDAGGCTGAGTEARGPQGQGQLDTACSGPLGRGQWAAEPHRCFLTVICQDGEKKGPVQAVRKALRLSCCVTLSRSLSLPALQASPIFF